MKISYVYRAPLPSQLAAWIQILNTCHAVARLGVTVEVIAERIDSASMEAALGFYGLAPHPNLTISTQLPDPLRTRYGTVHDTAVVGRLSRADVGSGEPTYKRDRTFEDRFRKHCIISRDDKGIAYFHSMAGRPRDLKTRHVFEAHRVAHLHRKNQPARGLTGKLRRWLGFSRPLIELERETLESADGLICLTEAVEEDLRHAFSFNAPVLILPSGVTIPIEPFSFEARDIDILYAGKLMRRKGVEDLIAAMEHLSDCNCKIAGGKPEEVEEMRRLARERGVQKQIKLLGFVEPARIPALMRRARVGVCPLPAGSSDISERYTSPLKILEMMACGVPVVASDLPSVRRILEHEKTGLLYPAGDAAALAAAIRRMRDDETLARGLAERARVAVVPYSWDSRARKLIGFIEKLFAD